MSSTEFNIGGIFLSDQEYYQIASFVHRQSGINLSDNKKELVKARLMKRLRFHKLNSYSEYYELLLEDKTGEELVELLNAISTNVTYFFREEQHFKFMYQSALPALFKQKKDQKSNRIRIWSSASATGEEIYTIIMTVCECLPDWPSWDIKVLGTDISTRALAVAQDGVYEREKVDNIPIKLREKYFDEMKEGQTVFYKVKQKIRDMAVFRRLNLMRETFPFKGKFDIIFCRNVMIYFDRKTQEALVKKFYCYLNNSGYLFIGHSESLAGADIPFKRTATAIFQKE